MQKKKEKKMESKEATNTSIELEVTPPKTQTDTPSLAPNQDTLKVGPITQLDQLSPQTPPKPRKPRKSPKGVAYIAPMKGFVWNPLLKLARNRPCPCLSNRKFKQCCLNKLPKAIPESLAKDYREQMAKPDLIFITKENEERVKHLSKSVTADSAAYGVKTDAKEGDRITGD